MTIKELLSGRSKSDSFLYMMLYRMMSDCDYYLKEGKKNKKFLWSKDEYKHIECMKAIYDFLEEKPEWIEIKDILFYERNICRLF